MLSQTQDEWQGGGIGTLLCLLCLQYALRELGCRFVVSYAMHPAIRKCLSSLGFADASNSPAPGVLGGASKATGGAAATLDVAALFAGTNGGGGGAAAARQPASSGGGGSNSATALPAVSQFKALWTSIAELRGACINRVLDCDEDGPHAGAAAEAITRYYQEPRHLPRPKLDLASSAVVVGAAVEVWWSSGHGEHAGWYRATIQSIDRETDRVALAFAKPFASYGPAVKLATRIRLPST